MYRIMSSLLVSVFALAFFSMKPIELDAPLPKEEGKWHHVPGEISLFLDEGSRGETLRFVVEGEGQNPSVILSLDSPNNQDEIKAFLKQCKSYLDPKGRSKSAVVAMGRSVADQVQQWISENIAQSDEHAPDLNGVLFGMPALQVLQQPEGKEPLVQVTYGFSMPKMQTSRDLRKFWSLALVQQMTKERLKAQKISCEEVEPSSQFLLPEKRIAYRLSMKETDKDLKRFLKGMQEIRQVGFTGEELTEAKRVFSDNLHRLQQSHPTKGLSTVASFHAEGFLRNLGLLSYAYFLDSASTLINSITPVDVAIALNECYDDEKRQVILLANASKGEAMELLVRNDLDESDQLHIDHTSDPVATEAAPPASDPFFQLTLNKVDEEIIYKIIDTMARDNVIKLGLKRKTMERKGKKIRHVHPLRFLGCIFSDPHLHSCMREVHRSMFKWNGFIDGLKDRLREEGARGNLYQYVPGFAQLLNRDPKKITHYLEKRDWDGLVRYLL